MAMDYVTSDKNSACVGCDITFTATTDPTGYEDDVEWSGGDDPSTGGGATFTTHWDTSGTKTVTAELCDSEETKQVTIVKVDKVVKSGTTDEGPIYVCPDDTVSLEAKPAPAGASFPSGEPHWSVESQPTGASASLNPSSGSATTTLSGLTELGDYVIKAKCGDSDDGDTITVTNELQDETDWLDYEDPAIPGSCFLTCDGEDATKFDDCEHELEVSCCEPDGTGGVDCAYRYFYDDGIISSCIWFGNAANAWWYKEATVGDSSLKVFTKARHTTQDTSKFDTEGCWGYYCSKITIYNCQTGDSTVYWRRSATVPPLTETDGEEHECDGP